MRATDEVAENVEELVDDGAFVADYHCVCDVWGRSNGSVEITTWRGES